MRFPLAAATFAVLLACATPASATTIYTFSLSDGSDADPGSILSFSFDPLGAGGTLTVLKQLDSFTPIVFAAVAAGTIYPSATFSAFDDVVSPGSLLFRYDLTTALFISDQLVTDLEQFAVSAETVTLTRGPATAPEPATLLLMGVGAALIARRTVRSTRSRL